MNEKSVVVLGGGLGGMATAYALARGGWRLITIVEGGTRLGGLAGCFERDGKFYPLGYHHISYRDRTLLFFLHLIGALDHVRWRKICMLFSINGRLENLATIPGFLRFPMRTMDKFRFVRMMLKAFNKCDWSDWEGRSVSELIDAWGGPGVRRAIFEELTRAKFELSCDEVSAAWLGARLYSREGSSPLGYVPDTTWTKVLCEGLTDLLCDSGVEIRVRSPIAKVHSRNARVAEVELADGVRIGGDLFVSNLPTEIYCGLVPADETSDLRSIRYTALISAVCATRQPVEPDFYWMVLQSREASASGIFMLNSLNPTIGGRDENVVNLMTHLNGRDRPLFRVSDDELMARYFSDFSKIFGFGLDPFWTNITRVPMYSPIFFRNYRNPGVRSTSFENVYFAGNYRTFPSTASTGTALRSGLQAAETILHHHGGDSDLLQLAERFRPRTMRRA